ncbi:hypothetical protein KA005_67415 [bacterium]|nr:hypothetical protein [bacterium]
MKLSWRKRWTKWWIIQGNKSLLSDLLKRPIADCFAGTPKVTKSERMTFVDFAHVNVGISCNDNLDSIPTWVHEFCEHAVSRVILNNLVESGLTLEEIKDIICNRFILISADGNWYSPTPKHMIAALCTESSINGIQVTPEEFALKFGF